ncbi:PAS domain S-box protein [Pantanalinema sp. GBBB05]|uniref:PAS domain S-box protein n=1 Tax=Pantanalinema sp. GBBB05 TaxID=2604139 RepID=UPI001D677128|nr:PAS domain S-box protein [Pantanalinema sp. GBBB05]
MTPPSKRVVEPVEPLAFMSDEHFRRMVSNIPGMIYQYVRYPDGSGRFPFVGYKCLAIYEVAPEVIQNDAQVLWNMTYGEDQSALAISIQHSGESLQPWNMQWRILTPSGHLKWVEGMAKPTRLEDGVVVWDGVLLDITDRKKLEEERDRFFQLPLDILGIADLNWQFRQVNPAVTLILGYGIEEFLVLSFMDLIHPDDRQDVLFQMQRLAKGATIGVFEIRCCCQDGSYKWLSWRAVRVLEEQLVYTVARDITSRKLAEEALQRSHDELEQRVQERTIALQKAYRELACLIDNSPLAVIEWDRDLRIRGWSAQAEQLFGWTAEEVIGLDADHLQLIYEADRADVQLAMSSLRDGSQPQGTYCNCNYTKNQSIIYCEWYNSALFDESGNLISVLSLVLDVTQRRQAEADLQASQQRFATAFHCSPVPLSITTFPDGTHLDVNASWTESTGYSRVEAIGRTSAQLQFWLSEAEKTQFLETLREQGAVREMLMHSKVKDGQVRKMSLSSHLIELDSQSCLLNVAIDITASKQTEELLKRQLTAIETSIDGVAILDQSGRYTYLNQAHAQLFGYHNPEDLIGKSWRELYDTSEGTRFEQEILPTLSQQGYWRGEVIGKHQSGRPIFQEMALTRLEDGGLICICHNISERKRFEAELLRSRDELETRIQERTEELENANAYLQSEIIRRKKLTEELASSEEAQRQSEARLQAILDNAQTMIYLKDTQGRHLLMNRRLQALLGRSQADIIGKTYHELFPESTADLLWHNDQKVLAARTSLEFEETIQQSDGIHTYLSVKFPLLNAAGIPYAVGGISTDITVRKQIEAKTLQALEQEKELNELKSRFITNTSHEFRTPLTTILGSAELLEHSGERWSETKKQKHYQRIRSAVQHLTQLLDDVLTLSKAEVGKISCTPKLIDIVAFCRNLVEDLQTSTTEQNILFTCSEPVISAELDEKLLRQILENLLSNAIKYSYAEGSITFSLHCLDNQLILEIQDQGIGIPEADLPHLFHPFHRGENVGTIAGNGLGLAIIKRAVDLHHGSITIDSQVGIGTTCTVYLPVSQSR